MYLITSWGDNPVVVAHTLADAEEFAMDMEMESQYKRFCALMIHRNMSPTGAIKMLKRQDWQYRIREIGVI